MTPVAPTRGRLILAFAAVYLLWGSTYLAIHVAIETLPPFLMAGARHLLAGALLFAFARFRGAPAPVARDWLPALVIGGLLLLGGNGGVSWSQQRVPSGLAALIVASMPLWMVLMEWLRPGGCGPRKTTMLGIALGAVGLALLVGPGEILGGSAIDPLGAGVLVLASLSWALGSLISRAWRGSGSPWLAASMQMLSGGALLVVFGLAVGEGARLDLARVSTGSWLAYLYLVVFGSLAGFTAYLWLLGATTVAKASTYAYVNPVVAVFLGWAFAGEAVTPRVLVAAAIIIAAVVIITAVRPARARATSSEPASSRRPALGSAGR